MHALYLPAFSVSMEVWGQLQHAAHTSSHPRTYQRRTQGCSCLLVSLWENDRSRVLRTVQGTELDVSSLGGLEAYHILYPGCVVRSANPVPVAACQLT